MGGALDWASTGASGPERKAPAELRENKSKIEMISSFRITGLNDAYILHSLIPHFKIELIHFTVILMYSLDHQQTEEQAGLHILKKIQFVWLVTTDQVKTADIKAEQGFEEKKDDTHSPVAFPAESSLWKVVFRKVN